MFISKNKELAQAILIIWYLSGGISIFIFLLVFFAHPESVYKEIAVCEYKIHGRECFMCGSTRAFFQLKDLNVSKAFQLNKLSPFLFLGLLLNNVLLVIYTIKKVKL